MGRVWGMSVRDGAQVAAGARPGLKQRSLSQFGKCGTGGGSAEEWSAEQGPQGMGGAVDVWGWAVGSPVGASGAQGQGPGLLGSATLRYQTPVELESGGSCEVGQFGAISQWHRATFCMFMVESVIWKMWVSSGFVN